MTDRRERELAGKTVDLRIFQDAIGDPEVKLIALEKRIAELQQEMQRLRARRTSA